MAGRCFSTSGILMPSSREIKQPMFEGTGTNGLNEVSISGVNRSLEDWEIGARRRTWIHLNRGQHPELKSYPVDTIVGAIDSVHVFLSDDVPLGRVRSRIAGQVREEPLDENVEVEVIDYASKERR